MLKTSFSLACSALSTAGALAAVLGFGTGTLQAAPTAAPISGEIQHLSLTTPGDYWSGGTIVVGNCSTRRPRPARRWGKPAWPNPIPVTPAARAALLSLPPTVRATAMSSPATCSWKRGARVFPGW